MMHSSYRALLLCVLSAPYAMCECITCTFHYISIMHKTLHSHAGAIWANVIALDAIHTRRDSRQRLTIHIGNSLWALWISLVRLYSSMGCCGRCEYRTIRSCALNNTHFLFHYSWYAPQWCGRRQSRIHNATRLYALTRSGSRYDISSIPFCLSASYVTRAHKPISRHTRTNVRMCLRAPMCVLCGRHLYV